MKHLRGLAAAMFLTATASAAAGLTTANFVDVGDAIVDMLDTGGLTYPTWMLGQVDTARPRPAAFTNPLRPPRTEPFDVPCPGGGSIDGRLEDRDASGDLSVRDRFVTTFRSCRLDGGVVSGSSEFTITAHRFEGASEITELEFRFRALGTDALRWSGPARVQLHTDGRSGSERIVVTYLDMAVTRGPRASHWGVVLDMRRPAVGDHTASVTGTMRVGALLLRLAQDDPFVLAAETEPRSGRVTATDADGDRLQVEAGRRRYIYRLYRRDNLGETPDSSSQSQPHGRR